MNGQGCEACTLPLTRETEGVFKKITIGLAAYPKQMNKMTGSNKLEVGGNGNYMVGNHLSGIIVKSLV